MVRVLRRRQSACSNHGGTHQNPLVQGAGPVPEVNNAERQGIDGREPMTTTPNTLTIEALTAEAFRPFGDVIEASDAAHHFTINQGFAERYHDLAQVDTAEGGHTVVSLFKALPRRFPLAITVMERHLLGSQAFVALAPVPFLVVVAPPGDAPGPQGIRCFLAGPGQGVNYARGTWHHPLIALDAPGDFLVIDRAGPACEVDCEEVALAHGALWLVRGR